MARSRKATASTPTTESSSRVTSVSLKALGIEDGTRGVSVNTVGSTAHSPSSTMNRYMEVTTTVARLAEAGAIPEARSDPTQSAIVDASADVTASCRSAIHNS